MLSTYFGDWTYWEAINVSNQIDGPEKVVFDVYNKIMFVSDGVTEVDVKEDIYSAYKRFVICSKQSPTPAAFENAISAIGGEPLTDILNVGSTFFLENGWRIQPYASDEPYQLTINGNLYTREAGGNPFLFAEGASVRLTLSNLVDQVVATAAITDTDYNNIARFVWERTKADPNVGSYGELLNLLEANINTLDITRLNKALTKGEFLALK